MEVDLEDESAPTTTDSNLNEDKEDEIYVPPILESISPEEIDNFQPYYKRFYEEKYCTTFSQENRNLDLCIKVHTNKVCVVYLSPKHSLFQNRQRISRFNFQVSNKLNRLKNEYSGKRKTGAQNLTPESILCYIETEDDTLYPVHAGVPGRLIEINCELIENPNIVVEDNLCDGFIALILPDIKKHEANIAALKSSDEYFKT